MQPLPVLAIAPVAAFFLLAGCASPGQFPSLARRPAELVGEGAGAPAGEGARIGGSGLPAAPASGGGTTQQAVSEELAARVAQLGEAARAANERFAGKRARAATLVSAARGASVGSEAWSVATVAVADLESSRSDVMLSLGELDRLYAAARVDGGDGGAIAAVRDQVTAWVADEDAVLADLGGRLQG